MKKPRLIQGDIYNDERGILSYVNDFNFTKNKFNKYRNIGKSIRL